MLKEKKKIRIPGNQTLNKNEKVIPYVLILQSSPLSVCCWVFPALPDIGRTGEDFILQPSITQVKQIFFFLKFGKIFVIVVACFKNFLGWECWS